MNLPKLELISKEGIKHELKMKRIDEDFLIDYIVKINKTYNKLIDKVNEQDQIIREAREFVKEHTYDESVDGDGTSLMFEKANGNDLLEILDRNVK